MRTLGDGARACGSGVSAKMRRRGVTGSGRDGRSGDWRVELGGIAGVLSGGGDTGDEATLGGVFTLGGVLSVTLGGAGGGRRDWVVVGGGRRRHASKSSRSWETASSWEMEVGSGVSLRAPAIEWRPWMILSSDVGVGMVRKACRNSTVSEMTWLLVSLLTRRKHR